MFFSVSAKMSVVCRLGRSLLQSAGGTAPPSSSLGLLRAAAPARWVSSTSSAPGVGEEDLLVEYLDGDRQGIVVFGLNRPKVTDCSIFGVWFKHFLKLKSCLFLTLILCLREIDISEAVFKEKDIFKFMRLALTIHHISYDPSKSILKFIRKKRRFLNCLHSLFSRPRTPSPRT